MLIFLLDDDRVESWKELLSQTTADWLTYKHNKLWWVVFNILVMKQNVMVQSHLHMHPHTHKTKWTKLKIKKSNKSQKNSRHVSLSSQSNQINQSERRTKKYLLLLPLWLTLGWMQWTLFVLTWCKKKERNFNLDKN